MSEHGFQFRTAILGGFEKKDVMAYLEKSARDHAQRVAQLQKQLEEARSAISTDGETQQAQAQRIEALEADNRRLALSVTEAEALRARVAALEAEVERLTPAASAYEAVREKAANISTMTQVCRMLCIPVAKLKARPRKNETQSSLFCW